jgi:hypothetical protein
MRFIIFSVILLLYICNKLFFYLHLCLICTQFIKQQPTKIYIMKTVSSIVENYIKTKPFY